MGTHAGHATYVEGALHVNGHATFWKDANLVGKLGSVRVDSFDHPDMMADRLGITQTMLFHLPTSHSIQEPPL